MVVKLDKDAVYITSNGFFCYYHSHIDIKAIDKYIFISLASGSPYSPIMYNSVRRYLARSGKCHFKVKLETWYLLGESDE